MSGYHREFTRQPTAKPQCNLRVQDGSVWLTQSEMRKLFQTTKQNVSLHIKNVLAEEELAERLQLSRNP